MQAAAPLAFFFYSTIYIRFDDCRYTQEWKKKSILFDYSRGLAYHRNALLLSEFDFFAKSGHSTIFTA